MAGALADRPGLPGSLKAHRLSLTLDSPTWLLGGLTETDATTINDVFEEVTVETPIDIEKKFIRVRAE